MAPCLMKLCVALIVCNALHELPPVRALPSSTARLNDNSYDSSVINSDDSKTTSSLALAKGSGKWLTRPMSLSGFLVSLRDLGGLSRTPLLLGEGRNVQTRREEAARKETTGSAEQGEREDNRSFLALSMSELQALMTRDNEVLETAFRNQNGMEPQQGYPALLGTQPEAAVNSLAYLPLASQGPIYRRDGRTLGVTWWQRQQGNNSRSGPSSNLRSPFRPPGQSRAQTPLSQRNSSKGEVQNPAIEINPFERNDSGNLETNLDLQKQRQVTGDDSERTRENTTFPFVPQIPVERDTAKSVGKTNQDPSSLESLSKEFEALQDEGRLLKKTQQPLTIPELMQTPGEENKYEPPTNNRQDDLSVSSEVQDSSVRRRKESQDHASGTQRTHTDRQELRLVNKLPVSVVGQDEEKGQRRGNEGSDSSGGADLETQKNTKRPKHDRAKRHIESSFWRDSNRLTGTASLAQERTGNTEAAVSSLDKTSPRISIEGVKMSGLQNPVWLSRPASFERTSDNFWRLPSNVPPSAINAPGSHGVAVYGGNLMMTGQGQQQGISVVLHVVNESTSAISQGSYLQYDPVTGQIIPITGTSFGNSSDTAGVVVGYLQVDPSRHIYKDDPIFGLVSLDDPSLQANSSDLATVIQNGAYLQFNPLGASTQQADTTTKQVTAYLQLAPPAQALMSQNAGQQRAYIQFDPVLNGLLGMNTGGYVLASALKPTRNLFLRMFKEGEIYLDGGAVVQNFYTDGDFTRTLAHFRALPLEGVGHLEGGHALGGHLKGYTVTACDLCGPHGEPMIEFVSKFSANPVIKRRFLYVPQLPAPAHYVAATMAGGMGHHTLGLLTGLPVPIQHYDARGLWNHVPRFDDGETYSSVKDKGVSVEAGSKRQLALRAQETSSVERNTSPRKRP